MFSKQQLFQFIHENNLWRVIQETRSLENTTNFAKENFVGHKLYLKKDFKDGVYKYVG